MMKLNHHIGYLTLGIALSLVVAQPALAAFPVKYHPGHYMLVYFDLKNPSTAFKLIQNESQFVGVQRRYTWKRLEPRRGVYDFSAIAADLNFLRSMPTPKRLIIQFTDVGTDRYGAPHIPDYLKTAEFDGGYYKSSRGNVVTRRWNTAVQDRQIALFRALGAKFDKEPFIEGVVLEETATGISSSEWDRANYTGDKAFNGLKRIMSGLKAAFPTTMCIQYINYFSAALGQGEAALAGLAQHAFQIGMGFGGPDVHVNGNDPAYKYYGQYAGSLPLATAVQHEDYDVINKATGRKVTAVDILNFARSRLHLTHINWVQREPQFSTDVLPTVRRMGAP